MTTTSGPPALRAEKIASQDHSSPQFDFTWPEGSSDPEATPRRASSDAATAVPHNPSVASFDDEPTWPTGWRPWACLFGCFLLMWNSWGIVNAYGTFQSYYSQHLLPDTPLLLLNLIGATQSFVVLVFSFVVGRLLDANYARYLLGGGSFFVTLGSFLLSVVNGDGGYGQGSYGLTWLTQGLIVGLGQACFFVSSSQIVSTYFIKRKAVAIGIVASGASVAGLVYPMMIKFLITEVGFNNAARYQATLVAVTCLISFFTAVPNPKHNFRRPKKWLKTEVWLDTGAFRNPSFLWFSASISFVFFGFYAVFFNLENWAASYDFARRDSPPGLNISLGEEEVDGDAIRTFWLLCIMNISSTAGRLFSACFAEYFGAVNVHTVATALGSLLLFLLWPFSKSLPPALIFVIVFGAVSGSIIGMPPASIAFILGREDASQQAKLGQWTGMMYTISSPFSLTGPVIAGYLVEAYGPENFLTVQMWSGSCLFLAAVCMAMSRYYLGPSRAIEALRKMSVVFSRVTTLEGTDGETEKKLAGLGKTMEADKDRDLSTSDGELSSPEPEKEKQTV